MLKILVYLHAQHPAQAGLRFAAHLRNCLGAELAVMTCSPTSQSAGEPPPVGRAIPLQQAAQTSPGLARLTHALAELCQAGVLPPTDRVELRDMPHGHVFVVQTRDGSQVPFIESFGHLVEETNRVVEEHGYDLLLVAPPPCSGLKRWTQRDVVRMLALDLHCSLLVVRAADAQSPYLICSDGTPAARRIFPLLQRLLPAIGPAVDLLCLDRLVHRGKSPSPENQQCLAHARQWLGSCGKSGRLEQPQSGKPLQAILERAGAGSVIVMGASLRHDVVRRLGGSLPLRVLRQTLASMLLVKLPPEADAGFFAERDTCETKWNPPD